MKIKFWGVRGSIPAPGAHTVRYGGNTTCIEVRSDSDDLIILDGGTGIFPLARSLLDSLPLTAHIFSTHSHWDHIQGLPFFTPIFIPGNRINLYAGFDPVSGQGAERIMGVQMQYSYFPVREAEFKSHVEYITVMPGETVRAGSAEVKAVLLNHPVINFGYRITSNGKSIFFTGDHEAHLNLYSPGDEDYAEYQALLDEQSRSIAEAIRGVEVLIADCSYTREEYAFKKGWGHGTFDSGIALAKSAGAKILYCTHHLPTRSDDELERVFAEALAQHEGELDGLDVRLAREGEEIVL